MTVSELIEELKKYPGDIPIVAHHEGDTFWDCEPVTQLMDRDKDGQYHFAEDLCDQAVTLEESRERMWVALFW